jgi:uncharacterized protein YjfI (DUF2170 family)
MRKRLQLFNAYFFVLLACTWTQRTLAQSNRKILFNGNEIELSTPSTDTLYIENIETGEREIKVSIPDPFPIAMNGKTIINETHCSPLPERSLNEYFIDLVLQNKTLFDQLTDGQYYINPRHFVINEEGSIKYYKFEGITLRMHHSSIDIVTKNDVVKSKINKLINDFIQSGNIQFEAAEKEGKKILAVAHGAYVSITVKDHKANVDL